MEKTIVYLLRSQKEYLEKLSEKNQLTLSETIRKIIWDFKLEKGNKVKKRVGILTLLFLFLFSSQTFANVYVRGYYRSNGTYVAPHYRTSPNNTKYDNWSTKGNVNPYTGQYGTKDPGIYYSPYSGSRYNQYQTTRSQYGGY